MSMKTENITIFEVESFHVTSRVIWSLSAVLHVVMLTSITQASVMEREAIESLSGCQWAVGMKNITIFVVESFHVTFRVSSSLSAVLHAVMLTSVLQASVVEREAIESLSSCQWAIGMKNITIFVVESPCNLLRDLILVSGFTR